MFKPLVRWCIGLGFCMTLHSTAFSGQLGADRPFGNPSGTRSVMMAPHGIVATSHGLAAQAGLDMLRQGGSAVDAAIAANAVLGVVEPMSCGLGGDLFALVWEASTQKLHGLNASGRSPLAATRDYFASQNLSEIPIRGPLSWSVPGCVSGWKMLHERFGKLPLEAILKPAMDYAEKGFPVNEIIGGYWLNDEKLLQSTPEGVQTFLKNGQSPKVGDRMTNPFLSKTLRTLVEEGLESFYQGSIAREMDRYSRQAGGLLRLGDLEHHTANWVTPVSTSYRGYDVWELPPNGQGIAALQMLNILELSDIKAMGHNSPDFLHLFIEAKKLAFEDRARYYADPDFETSLPTSTLISKPYAQVRSRRIDPSRAAKQVEAGDPKLIHGDTIYLVAADSDRNVVSFIQSIYYGWGSGHVAGDLGFMLQNRGNSFSLDPLHRNRLEPGKRPFHTIIPGMVTQKGKAVLGFGVMGGDMQPQGHVQVLCNILDHGMDVQEATDASRVRHFGSSTPTGSLMTDGGYVEVESGISDDTLADLIQRGHQVKRTKGSFGGYQAIWIDWENDMLHGGSDSRKDGAALGY